VANRGCFSLSLARSLPRPPPPHPPTLSLPHALASFLFFSLSLSHPLSLSLSISFSLAFFLSCSISIAVCLCPSVPLLHSHPSCFLPITPSLSFFLTSPHLPFSSAHIHALPIPSNPPTRSNRLRRATFDRAIRRNYQRGRDKRRSSHCTTATRRRMPGVSRSAAAKSRTRTRIFGVCLFDVLLSCG
jgi:hypothetical protein